MNNESPFLRGQVSNKEFRIMKFSYLPFVSRFLRLLQKRQNLLSVSPYTWGHASRSNILLSFDIRYWTPCKKYQKQLSAYGLYSVSPLGFTSKRKALSHNSMTLPCEGGERGVVVRSNKTNQKLNCCKNL